MDYGPIRTVIVSDQGRPLGLDEKGHGPGEVIVPTELGDVTLRWVIDERGLRITELRADNITASLLRLRLGEITEKILEMLRRDPSRSAPAALIAAHGATPSNDHEAALFAEQSERARRAVEMLKEVQPQRTHGPGKRENPESKAFYAEMYLYCVRVYGQKAIVGMERELQRPPYEVYWMTTDSLRTKVRRLREDEWLTEAPAQGRAGGEPGPKLIEWRKKHE